jgi:KamA family protein/D-alanine--D-alanine ligase
VVPTVHEFLKMPGEADDPLGEEDQSPVPGLVHRYPDRVLLLALDFCSTYCRYCTRSRIVGHGAIHPSKARLEKAIDYIRSKPVIRDVLISGGDPLTLNDERLEWLLVRLRQIPHVEIIRIGTKIPAVLPQRITSKLARMLRKYHPLWMSVHFTHPAECTPQAYRACDQLADAGIPLGSQTVLLKDINDDVETQKELMHHLLRMRVRPYYLYQCDPISGSSHFRTPVEKGLNIIRGLRGFTSGYAVPTYVIDAPGGGGKIPLMPDYVMGHSQDSLLLRNYEGKMFQYPDTAVLQSGERKVSGNGSLLVGLTYDLRSEYLAQGFTEDETAEFDREDTISALESTLNELGHQTDRIGNARQLADRLIKGDRWDLVFNIAEGLYGIGREAQVPAILDAYRIPYTFSDPLVMSLTLHKGMTKRIIRDAGLPTSDFAIVERGADTAGVSFAPPFFVKPVAEGTGKGVSAESIVWQCQDLRAACEKLLAAYHQPVLVERYLPGREFTVGLVGTGTEAEVLGTMEVHLLPVAEQGVYSYHNKEHCEELVEYRLVRADEDPLIHAAEKIALEAWRVLGCRDAGRIDLRCDENGRPQFIEVNPLAGLHPEHSDLPIICNHLGISFRRLIARIVKSAADRIQPNVACPGTKQRCA